MARLEDKGPRRLPAPPAPTRRGANPWRLSDTARRREAPPPRGEQSAERLLQEMFGDAPQEEAPPGARPGQADPGPPAPRRMRTPWSSSRRRHSFWPLLVLLLIAGVLVKLAIEARESGDWRELIPAIFAIAFIAHGIWRSRRRREGQEEEPDRNG
ncbi:MAG: hypothetical protein KF822_00775 [Steroidobacteraceae bacterium]|nr:hypothetical protein [Steroidobacteraceae bacterium]